MKLNGGEIKVPVKESGFGKWCDLSSRIPADCDCIMVLVNSGSGLNAGYPKPVGFVKLTHQLYVDDLKKLLEEQTIQSDLGSEKPRWITVVPFRSKDYVDVWERPLIMESKGVPKPTDEEVTP